MKTNRYECSAFAEEPCKNTARRFRPLSRLKASDGAFRHLDSDVHAGKGFGRSPVGATQRYHLIRRPSDSDTDEIAVADNSISGIKIDPTSARPVCLQPSVRIYA